MLRWTAGTRVRAQREWRQCKPSAPWLNYLGPSNLSSELYGTPNKHLQHQSRFATSDKQVNTGVRATNKQCLQSQARRQAAQVENNRAINTTTKAALSSSTSTTAKAQLLVKQMLYAKQRQNQQKNVLQQQTHQDNRKSISEHDNNANRENKRQFTFARERARMRNASKQSHTPSVQTSQETRKCSSTSSKCNHQSLQSKCATTNQPQARRLRQTQQPRLSADEIALQWPLRQQKLQQHPCKRYSQWRHSHHSRPSSCISSHSSNASSLLARSMAPKLLYNVHNMSMPCKDLIKQHKQRSKQNTLRTIHSSDTNVIYDNYAQNQSNKFSRIESDQRNNVCTCSNEKSLQQQKYSHAHNKVPSQVSPATKFAISTIPQMKVKPTLTNGVDDIFCTDQSTWPAATCAQYHEQHQPYQCLPESNDKWFDCQYSMQQFSLYCVNNIALPKAQDALHKDATYNLIADVFDQHRAQQDQYFEQCKQIQNSQIFNNVNNYSSSNNFENNQQCQNNVNFDVYFDQECNAFIDNPLIDVTAVNQSQTTSVNDVLDYNCNSNYSIDELYTHSQQGVSTMPPFDFQNSANCYSQNGTEQWWQQQQQQSLLSHGPIYSSSVLPQLQDTNLYYNNKTSQINVQGLRGVSDQSIKHHNQLYTHNALPSGRQLNKSNMYVSKVGLPTVRSKSIKQRDNAQNQSRRLHKYSGISQRCRQFRERCRRQKHM